MRKIIFVVGMGLSLSACGISNPNKLALTGLGAAGGGVLGSHIGKGKGRLAATFLGTILGAATGSHVGGIFDGVSHNTTAINRNHLQIHKLRQEQQSGGYSPSPIIYQHHYNQQRQPNIQLNCRVVANYVRCDGG